MKIHLFLILLGFTATIHAQQRFWVGTTSTDWNTAANWSTSSGGAGGASVPGTTDQVLIDQSTPNACILGTATTIQQLTVSAGSLSLNATANLTVSNNFLVQGGSLTMTTGSIITANGAVTMSNGTFDLGGGVMTVPNNTLTLSGGTMSLGSGSLTANSVFSITNGTFNANSGTVTVPSNTFSLSGGVLNAGSANFFIGNNMIIGSPLSVQPGTSTVTFNGAGQQDVLAIASGVPGTIVFYNLVINKPGNSQINFNTVSSTDTFQINNLLTLRAGRFTGSGFIKIEKDVTTEAAFGGSGIPIACTGSGPSIVTLGAVLAVTGASNFVGIAKSSPSATVSVYRAAGTPDDTIRIGNFDARFIVNSGIIQFPDNPPILARFKTIEINPGGTLKAPQNYLFNSGQHINTGGTFDANGGTYVFYYPSIPSATQITNHIETFNNLIIDNQTQFGPGTNDTLVVNGTFIYRSGTNAGQPASAFNLKGNMIFETNVGASLGVTSIVFSGSSDQTVSFAPGKADVWNGPVTIDKPGGKLILNSPWLLDESNKVFTFKRGIVSIPDTANNYLYFTNAYTAAGASNASYVDGPVRTKRWTNDPFEFPIGNGGFYAPVRLSDFWGSSEDVTFSAQYFHQPSPLASQPRDVTLANVSQIEWWQIRRLTGTVSVPPYLWLSFDNIRSGGVSDPSLLRVSRWDGVLAMWQDRGNGEVNGNFIRSTQPVAEFSPFALASTSKLANPLPLQLISFNVIKTGDDALLTWRTDFEQNSNRFEIEQGNDGIGFSTIATVAAAGNSSSPVDYSYTDRNISHYGSNSLFYRLRQVDNDGRFTYSKIVMTRLNAVTTEWKVYPLPFTNRIIVDVPQGFNGPIRITITDVNGKMMFDRQQTIYRGQSNLILTDFPVLSSGTYILTLKNDKMMRSMKLIKQ